jgi:hemerythrin-like metal-binding protein
MRKSLQTLGLSLFIVLVVITIFLGFLWGIDNPVSWIGIAVLIALPYVHKKMTARHFVAWQDDMTVGVESIDNDHKNLLSLINDLQTAVYYHMGESFERKAIGELVDYTKYHFEREEGMMRAADYPNFQAHKLEHLEMIAQVKEFLAAYDKDRGATVDKMGDFLKTWLVNHIRGSDQKYTPYLREQGIR